MLQSLSWDDNHSLMACSRVCVFIQWDMIWTGRSPAAKRVSPEDLHSTSCQEPKPGDKKDRKQWETGRTRTASAGSASYLINDVDQSVGRCYVRCGDGRSANRRQLMETKEQIFKQNSDFFLNEQIYIYLTNIASTNETVPECVCPHLIGCWNRKRRLEKWRHRGTVAHDGYRIVSDNNVISVTDRRKVIFQSKPKDDDVLKPVPVMWPDETQQVSLQGPELFVLWRHLSDSSWGRNQDSDILVHQRPRQAGLLL